MAPALVMTTTVPAIVYATALFSDTHVDTRSQRDGGVREASMETGSAIVRSSIQERWKLERGDRDVGRAGGRGR